MDVSLRQGFYQLAIAVALSVPLGLLMGALAQPLGRGVVFRVLMLASAMGLFLLAGKLAPLVIVRVDRLRVKRL